MTDQHHDEDQVIDMLRAEQAVIPDLDTSPVRSHPLSLDDILGPAATTTYVERHRDPTARPPIEEIAKAVRDARDRPGLPAVPDSPLDLALARSDQPMLRPYEPNRRARYRQLALVDIPSLVFISWNDPAAWLLASREHHDHPPNLEQIVEFAVTAHRRAGRRRQLTYVIFDANGDQGVATLTNRGTAVHALEGRQVGEARLWLRTESRGKHIGTDAMRFLLAEASTYGYEVVIAAVHPDTEPDIESYLVHNGYERLGPGIQRRLECPLVRESTKTTEHAVTWWQTTTNGRLRETSNL